jgi:hypothetical protein
MEKKLTDLVESRVEVTCGAGLVFCGVLKNVDAGIIEIIDDHDDLTAVAIEKIIAVRKSVDPTSRPGFIV